ncbi:MAG: acyl-CoA desaturase [Thermoleophilia bacterium]|nr:acyl-CoA desaturase [Thermoleophilia bacterium]
MITLVAVIVPFVGVASAMNLLWGVALRPIDLVVLAGMYLVCGVGITVGFHRLFSHRSFKAGPVVRATFGILGCMTLQGPITQWVTDHRRHHAMSDREGDPHSPHLASGTLAPLRGLLHAHMGWLFVTKGTSRDARLGRDLRVDPVVRVVDRLYLFWVALSLGIPFLIGWLIGGVALGVEVFVWGGLMRLFLFQHATFSVNSICHTFGRRDYASDDESRNVALLAIPTLGEAWHNNHHAFPGSAIHGLGRRQIDLSGALISGLERLGLVWDVKRPTGKRMARRALTHAD